MEYTSKKVKEFKNFLWSERWPIFTFTVLALIFTSSLSYCVWYLRQVGGLIL